MTVTLAFYKGRGKTFVQRVQDGAIRAATRSIYSHVELIAGLAVHDEPAICRSSSGRDGGVREKSILLKPESWDLVPVKVAPEGPCSFIADHMGARYDYTGVLLSHVLALGRHNPEQWFCSEICAAALGIPNPQRVSPQLLFDVVAWARRG